MGYRAKANTIVNLRPSIVASDKGSPGVKAAFKLYLIDPGDPTNASKEKSITIKDDGSFDIPGQSDHKDASLRLDIEPAWNGATNADVYLTATQGGTTLDSDAATAGHPKTWICSVDNSTKTTSQPISIYFRTLI
jgi:hypothetical protein